MMILKKFVNRLIGALLSCVLVFTALFAASCKNKNSVQSSTPTSSSQVESSSSAPNAETPTYTLCDRSGYTIESLASAYDGYTFSDYLNAFSNGEIFENAEGFMLGDIFNSLVENINNVFPSGSNVGKLIGYSYDSDGNWRNNSTGTKTHKIMNALLSFRLDESQPLAISDDDLKVYGDYKIIDFSGYSKGVIDIINSYNPLVYNLLNSTLSQWQTALLGDFDDKILTIKDMVGESTCGDLMKLLGKSVPLVDDVALKNVVCALVSGTTLKHNYLKVCVLRAWMVKSSDVDILGQTLNVCGVNMTVREAIEFLSDFENLSDERLAKINEIGLEKFVLETYSALDENFGDELLPLVKNWADELLSDPISGSQTIKEILSKITESDEKAEIFAAYAFEIMEYVDTVYGDIEIASGLTLSDLILRINQFFSGDSEMQSFTIDEIVAIFKSFANNDLSSLAVSTISANEEAIKSEIEKFAAANSDVEITITYDDILAIAKNGADLSEITDDDKNCLKRVTIEMLLTYQNIEQSSTGNETIDKLLKECASISLYELLFGIDEDKSASIRSLFLSINPFDVISKLTTED